MNEKTNALTESCINKFHELANLFREKNKQYGDKDQLANFRNGAMLQYGDDSWEHMYETAKSYCLKHVAHVFGAGQTIKEEKIKQMLALFFKYYMSSYSKIFKVMDELLEYKD